MRVCYGRLGAEWNTTCIATKYFDDAMSGNNRFADKGNVSLHLNECTGSAQMFAHCAIGAASPAYVNPSKWVAAAAVVPSKLGLTGVSTGRCRVNSLSK